MNYTLIYYVQDPFEVRKEQISGVTKIDFGNYKITITTYSQEIVLDTNNLVKFEMQLWDTEEE